jgi:hypothetical protein
MPNNPCQFPSDIPSFITDPLRNKCSPADPLNRPNLNNVPFLDSTEDDSLGKRANCSPMQSGKIINDTSDPDRGVINRYPQSLRGTDMAMKDLFSSIIVLDVEGKDHTVPIIWGTQEKAVAAILQASVRKDNSLIADRIPLPIMSIYASEYTFDEKRYTYEEVTRSFPRPDGKPGSTVNEQFERDTVLSFSRGIPLNIGYTLTAWTTYIADMMQILTQIKLIIPKMTYIKVSGVHWEIPVTMTSISNNLNVDVGDTEFRTIKYQFSLMAETYLPQPIIRKKAVLKTVVDMVDAVDPNDIKAVISTDIKSVEELKNC